MEGAILLEAAIQLGAAILFFNHSPTCHSIRGCHSTGGCHSIRGNTVN